MIYTMKEILSGKTESSLTYFRENGQYDEEDGCAWIGDECVYFWDIPDDSAIERDLMNKYPDHEIKVEYKEDVEKDIDWLEYSVFEA